MSQMNQLDRAAKRTQINQLEEQRRGAQIDQLENTVNNKRFVITSYAQYDVKTMVQR